MKVVITEDRFEWESIPGEDTSLSQQQLIDLQLPHVLAWAHGRLCELMQAHAVVELARMQAQREAEIARLTGGLH